MIQNDYDAEEEALCKNIQMVPRSELPDDSNFTGSHTIYKITINDDKSLKLKANIASHGNEDSMRHDMKTDFCIYSPAEIHIILMLAVLTRS